MKTTYQHSWLSEIVAASATAEEFRILDYGCGTGFNLPYLAKFGTVVGADVAPPYLEKLGRPEEFPVLDLNNDTSEYHRKFDLITVLDVLEHMDDDVSGLRSVMRFLNQAG